VPQIKKEENKSWRGVHMHEDVVEAAFARVLLVAHTKKLTSFTVHGAERYGSSVAHYVR
jgi:hypothetical protein